MRMHHREHCIAESPIPLGDLGLGSLKSDYLRGYITFSYYYIHPK